MRGPILLLVFTTITVHAQQWMRVTDDIGTSNGISSVVVMSDSTFRAVSLSFSFGHGRLRPMAFSSTGDTLWTTTLHDTAANFQGGGSGSVQRTADGGILFTGTRFPFDGTEADGMLVCFGPSGDSLWLRQYGDSAAEALNGLCLVGDSQVVAAGWRQTSQSDAYVVKTDAAGNVIWENTYGGASTTENGISIATTPDGGFIIGGFKVLPGNNYDMYAVRIDQDGNQQWAKNYGTSWDDNAAFVVPNGTGGYVLAGGRSLSSSGPMRPVLYRLDEQGDLVWGQTYDDGSSRVFFALPLVMPEGGFVAAGTANGLANVLGMLMRTDSLGNMLWRRTFKTNDVYNHYFYDLRRTLDGGFIMAGTAFDSLLVSQDAWLVKVDSFGCLVPGCQVFDGLQEQITELSGSLIVSPNPAHERLRFELRLPEHITPTGAVLVTLIDATGRVITEQKASTAGDLLFGTIELPPSTPAGPYYLHLRDGRQWLAGCKVIVSKP